MGGKGSAPSAPDPYQVASAQAQYGQQTAAYNKALDGSNTVGPTGSTTQKFSGYDPATGAPIYTTTTQLTPQQQTIFNQQQTNETAAGATAGQLEGQAAKSLQAPLPGAPTAAPLQMGINTSGVPGIIGASDLAGFTQQAQDAAYKQQTQYLDPQFAQSQEQLDNQLKQSGAQPGSPAYNNAMELFNNQKQQAYSNAEEQAVGQGLQEQQSLYGESANTQQQLFGEAAAGQQATNAAAGQQFSQGLEGLQANLGLRDQPLTEYNSLMTGINPQLPSFGLGGGGNAQAQTPDIESAFAQQYQGQLAGYNADVSSANATESTIGSIAAMAALYF